MKLIYLHLKNYRKFEDVRIEFENGITGIIGANGAGKSSIVEAIEWALYGSVGKSGRGDKKENIKRVGAEERDGCFVEFGFELRGEKYTVKRWIKGKGNTPGAELFLADAGHLIADGTRDVTEKMEALLGFGVKPFEVSVFAKQSELAALSDMVGSQRKELILRLLGIERIDEAIDAAGKDERDLEYERERLHMELTDPATGRKYVDIRREELEAAQMEMEAARSEMEVISRRKKELEKEISAVERSIESVEEKRKKYEELRIRMGALEAGIASSVRDMERMKTEMEEIEKKRGRLDALRRDAEEEASVREALDNMSREFDRYRELDSLEREADYRRRELERTEAEIEELRKTCTDTAALRRDIEETTGKKDEAEMGLEELRGSLHRLLAEEERLSGEIRAVSDEKREIEELGEESECPTCHRPLKDHYPALLKELTDRMDELRSRAGDVRAEVEELRGKLNSEKRRKEALDKKLSVLMGKMESAERNARLLKERSSARDSLVEKIKDIETRMAAVGLVNYDENEMKRLKKEARRFEKSVREYHIIEGQMKRLPQIEKRFREAETAAERDKNILEGLRKEMAELNYNEAEYRELAKRNRELNSELREIEKRSGIEEGRLNMAVSRKEDIVGSIENLRDKERRKGELDERAIYISKVREVMADFKKSLMQRIRPTLSRFSSTLLREITEGKYPVIDFGENYEISVLDGNEFYPINRFSGGEKDLINLCIRLAISRAVSHFSGASEMNTIILDEVFGSQDADRKRNILKTLNALQKDFSQIVVISHMDDVKESVNSVIRVIEDPETKISTLVIE